MRKQNKTSGSGDSPHIDLETLRASTRAADIAEKGRNTSSKQTESSSSSSKTNSKPQQNSSETTAEANTSGTATPAPSQTHQGSFQLMNMMAPPQENHSSQNHGHGHPPKQSSSSSSVPTPMPGDSRPTSQHASTPQLHAPPLPSSAHSHHPQPHPHPLHPPHPPWPTTAATTGPAAAASGAVSVSSTASVRNGTSGVNGSSFGNPPSQSPVDFIRRQYSLQHHQPTSRWQNPGSWVFLTISWRFLVWFILHGYLTSYICVLTLVSSLSELLTLNTIYNAVSSCPHLIILLPYVLWSVVNIAAFDFMYIFFCFSYTNVYDLCFSCLQ